MILNPPIIFFRYLLMVLLLAVAASQSHGQSEGFEIKASSRENRPDEIIEMKVNEMIVMPGATVPFKKRVGVEFEVSIEWIYKHEFDPNDPELEMTGDEQGFDIGITPPVYDGFFGFIQKYTDDEPPVPVVEDGQYIYDVYTLVPRPRCVPPGEGPMFSMSDCAPRLQVYVETEEDGEVRGEWKVASDSSFYPRTPLGKMPPTPSDWDDPLGVDEGDCGGPNQEPIVSIFRVRLGDPNTRTPPDGCYRSCSSGGGGGGGGGGGQGEFKFTSAGSVQDSFGSGFDADGGRAIGPIYFRKLINSNSAILRSDFDFQPRAGVSTSDQDSGGVRTITTPNSRVEITNIDGGVEVKIFDGPPQSQTFTESRTYTRTNDPDYGVGMRTTYTKDGETQAVDNFANVSPDGLTRSWKRIVDGERISEGIETLNPANRTSIVEVTEKAIDSDGNEVPQSREQRQYAYTDRGDFLLKKTTGLLSGNPTVTSYQYDKGRLKSWQSSDGDWMAYRYDGEGEIELEMRPWLDSPAFPSQANETNCAVTKYVSEDVTEERILGQLISRSTSSEETAPANLFGLNAREDRSETIAANGNTEVSRTFYQSSEGGEYLGSIDENGVVTQVVKEKGTWDEATETFTAGLVGPSTTNTDDMPTRVTETTGTVGSLSGIPFKTTRSVRISDEIGTQVSETYVCTGENTYDLLSRTTYRYDAEGRLDQVTRDGSVISSTTYHADGSRTETGADGSSVTYAEINDRESSTTQSGGGVYNDVTTVTRSTPMERVRTTTSGGITRSSRSDYVGGTLISSTDEAGRTTSYSRNGNVRTTTYPGNVTVVETYYRDGQLKSVTGSKTVHSFYSYEVADGNIITTVRSGSANSSRWRRTVTDGLGRTVKEESPGPNGGVITTAYIYGPGGRLESTQRTGMGAERIVYDELGRPFRRGIDMDSSGALELASVDRITENISRYENDGGWWEVNEAWVYQTDGSATPTLQRKQRRKLGLGANSQTETTDSSGLVVNVSSAVDRATVTTTTTATSNQSTIPAVTVTRYGRLVSRNSFTVAQPWSYTYGAFGQLESVTNPRSNATTNFEYTTSGQQFAVVQPGPNGPIRLEQTYYPATHRNAGMLKSKSNGLGEKSFYAYNARGQISHQWGETEYPLSYHYDEHGVMFALHTYRQGDISDWSGDTLPALFSSIAPDITRWNYDPATGLLIQKLDAQDQGPTYTYYPSGLMESRTWNRGVTTTYGFSLAGQLLSQQYTDGTNPVTRTYRRSGELQTMQDSAGLTTYAYLNPGGRKSGETITGGLLDGATLAYSANGLGQDGGFQASIGSTTASDTSYLYHPEGRLDRVTDEISGFNSNYLYVGNSDHIDSVESKNSAGATVMTSNRTYDSIERLKKISQVSGAAAVLTSHDYIIDDANRRRRATRENGEYWDYGYNSRGEVTSSKKHLPNGNPLAGWQQGFRFDSIGNRLTSSSGGDENGNFGVSRSYVPNAVNQYESIRNTGTVSLVGIAPTNATVTVNEENTTRQGDHWAYQKGEIDNRFGGTVKQLRAHAVQTGAAPDGSDLEAVEIIDQYLPPLVEAPVYDTDGNLRRDSRWVYQWNGENRLVELTTSPAGIQAGLIPERHTYVYDGRGRRILQRVERLDIDTTTYVELKNERYLYDGWNPVAAIDAADAVIQRYLWGTDLSSSAQGAGGVGGLLAGWDSSGSEVVALCYGYDGNGNVSVAVDQANAEAVYYDYDAFGQTIAVWGDRDLAKVNRFGFSTKLKDESGMLYYGFRYYMPTTGRWASRDPIEERGGVNLYGFVGNSPPNVIDVLGLCWKIKNPLSGKRKQYTGTFWYSTSSGGSLADLKLILPGSDQVKSKLKFKGKNRRTVDANDYLVALEEELRNKIVSVSGEFKKRNITFGDPAFPPPSYNEPQLNAYFDENYDSSKLPTCDCFQALHLVMARSVQQSILPGGLYSELKYQTAFFYRAQKLMKKQQGIITGSSDVLKGDWGYIHGYETQQRGKWVPGNIDPAYPGENVINVGGDQYYGFIPGGGDEKSADEWKGVLKGGGNGSRPGDPTRFGRGGDVYFPDLPRIVTDAFNHLKKKHNK